MLATVHFLVGAAIGSQIGSWPIAFGVSFVSHFALDTLPHTDPGTLKRAEERGGPMNLTDLVLAALDLVIALLILWYLSTHNMVTVSIMAGISGAILPDVPSGARVLLPVLKSHPLTGWWYQFHRRIQRTVDKKDWLKGLLVELVVVALSLWLIFR